MTPDEMERRLLALERRAPTGIGVSSYIGGQQEIRVMQPGFAAILTSTFDATYGYSWAQLALDVSVPGIETQSVPKTGNRAFTPDNNKSLPVGTRGWLEIDPQAGGWILTSTASGMSGECCDCTDCPETIAPWAMGCCIPNRLYAFSVCYCPTTVVIDPTACSHPGESPPFCNLQATLSHLPGSNAWEGIVYSGSPGSTIVNTGANPNCPTSPPVCGGLAGFNCENGEFSAEYAALCTNPSNFTCFAWGGVRYTLLSCDPFCLLVDSRLTSTQGGSGNGCTGGDGSCCGTWQWLITSDPTGVCGQFQVGWACKSGVCTEVFDGTGGYATWLACISDGCASGCGSGSGSGSGSLANITWTPLGTAQGTGTTLTIPGVTLLAGQLLIVSLAAGTDVSHVTGVTVNGTSLSLRSSNVLPGATSVGTNVFNLSIAGPVVLGNIVISSSSSQFLMASALAVSGLASNAGDGAIATQGTATVPTATFGPTTVANEFWFACTLSANSIPISPGGWNAPFTSDGQDQANPSITLALQTAYDIVSATGSPNPTMNAVQPLWCMTAVAYK